MPIDKDGNITAPGVDTKRYITRYTVEAQYTSSEAGAGRIHKVIQDALDETLNMIDEQAFPEMELNIATSSHDNPLNAENPATLPEGEGEDGVQP